MKISVVVPTIRENSTLRFLNEWNEIFEKFGYFDETLTSALDVGYWLRIKDKTKWTFFDIVVSNYGAEETADSVKNRDKYIKNADLIRRKYLNKFEFAIYKLVKFLANFYRKY